MRLAWSSHTNIWTLQMVRSCGSTRDLVASGLIRNSWPFARFSLCMNLIYMYVCLHHHVPDGVGRWTLRPHGTRDAQANQQLCFFAEDVFSGGSLLVSGGSVCSSADRMVCVTLISGGSLRPSSDLIAWSGSLLLRVGLQLNTQLRRKITMGGMHCITKLTGPALVT